MNRLATINLIHLFDFYLAVMFLLSLLRRLGLYGTAVGIVVASPGRWPRLLRVMKEHRTLFLSWTTIRPLMLALGLWAVQIIASRVVWPTADLTINHLLDSWFIPLLLVITLIPMLAVDAYFLIRVGRIDRDESNKYFDMAESWLRGWKGPVVRALTFGVVDPRRMVSEEVRKALVSINELLNRNLYWMALQIGLRVLFGLSLWFTWAYLTKNA
jgi:hypothetical protein